MSKSDCRYAIGFMLTVVILVLSVIMVEVSKCNVILLNAVILSVMAPPSEVINMFSSKARRKAL